MKNVAVIFGGKSVEHDISIITAMQTMKNLKKYNVLPIYILPNGKFVTGKNLKDAALALKTCRKIVQRDGINMHVIDASYTFDRDKLIFRFLADNRIDFRELARELASIYKVRIELRQIGIRDKAREIGGYGPCGQKLCCARFLQDLNAVSINMAKNQNIALNPSKINGVCGRLMCCLKYEDECYENCRKDMKKIGDKVKTEHGEGTITGLDILKQKYKVNVPNYGIVEVDKNESN